MGADSEGEVEVRGAGTHWSLDLRIPVAVVGALLLQTGGAVWWASSVNANLAALQARVAVLEGSAPQSVAQGQQLAAVDAKITGLQESLRELKTSVAELIRGAVFPLKGERR